VAEFMGGCRYQFPVGECGAVHSYNRGCALALQRWVYARVAGMASLVLNLVAVNTAATIAACLLCLKRHDDDVLPPPECSRSAAGVWFDGADSKEGGHEAYLTSIIT
jgi:hypothetical protein